MADAGDGPGTDLQVPDGGQAPALGPGGPGGAGGPPEAGPPGGGPILAALARRQQGPGVSAPGPGNNADALTKVQGAVGMLNEALPGLMGHPAYKEVLRALNGLSKLMPQQEAPTAGIQQTQLGDMLRSTLKNALLQRIASGGKGGQPPSPTPSTPLPGA